VRGSCGTVLLVMVMVVVVGGQQHLLKSSCLESGCSRQGCVQVVRAELRLVVTARACHWRQTETAVPLLAAAAAAAVVSGEPVGRWYRQPAAGYPV